MKVTVECINKNGVHLEYEYELTHPFETEDGLIEFFDGMPDEPKKCGCWLDGTTYSYKRNLREYVIVSAVEEE